MFQIAIGNTFWFFIAYGVITMMTLKRLPKEKRQKILTRTPQGTSIERLCSVCNVTSRYIMMLLSFFLPFGHHLEWTLIGGIIYLLGLSLSTIAIWQFGQADLEKPVTSGLYHISRNPMHVMGFAMNIGIAILTENILMYILVLINIVVSYPMFSLQERFCLDKYGSEYEEYMEKTPRIIFYNRKRKNKL